MFAIVLTALSGCSGDGKLVWLQFNAEGQTIKIDVTKSDTLGEARELQLLSSTSQNPVGTAFVTPGSGPVGTQHEFVIVVDDAYEDAVQKVSILSNGERGEEDFTLRQDSADPGTWQLVIESLGAPEGEERVDTFTVFLWEPDELVEITGTTGGS